MRFAPKARMIRLYQNRIAKVYANLFAGESVTSPQLLRALSQSLYTIGIAVVNLADLFIHNRYTWNTRRDGDPNPRGDFCGLTLAERQLIKKSGESRSFTPRRGDTTNLSQHFVPILYSFASLEYPARAVRPFERTIPFVA